MDYDTFYEQLFRPLVKELGAADPETLSAVIGFTAGGPVSMRTFGRTEKTKSITYVTCELSVREEQKPCSEGNYELMIHCDDEDFARQLLTRVGDMSFEAKFDDGHTLDVEPWLGPDHPVQAVIFEKYCSSVIDNRNYAVLRLHGVSRDELLAARADGTDSVLAARKQRGVFPRTAVHNLS